MRISVTLALVVLIELFSTFALAQTFGNIYNFDGRVGNLPESGLVLDSAGNLYGTTLQGGRFSAGIVYELSPKGSGWAETTLYAFTGKSDGGAPQSSLVMDNAGNLFGTTTGLNGSSGTVFEISPAGGGTWTYKLVHAFTAGDDGAGPAGNLIFDAEGNAYGATSGGGTTVNGTVYEISPDGSGGWTESVIYQFQGGTDGSVPEGGLVFDSKGNLFGVTKMGGSSNEGTIYELSPANGSWQETILTSLNKSTGYHPQTGLGIDNKDRLYAVTVQPTGTVIELAPTPTGTFTKKVIHTFNENAGDGSTPKAAVTVRNGSLYGTTLLGGNQPCACGTLFKLTPGSNGTWTETIVHNFTRQDGGEPNSTPVFDALGNLYGTSQFGALGSGSVFEVTPHSTRGTVAQEFSSTQQVWQTGLTSYGPRHQVADGITRWR